MDQMVGISGISAVFWWTRNRNWAYLVEKLPSSGFMSQMVLSKFKWMAIGPAKYEKAKAYS